MNTDDPAPETQQRPSRAFPTATAFQTAADRVLTLSGYAMVLVSVLCFGVVAFINLRESLAGRKLMRYESWIDVFSVEGNSLVLILIALLTATLGKRLLTTVKMTGTRTIPTEDLPLIQQAVVDGKPEPIDQYVRIRSLGGFAGNFTKLGITGLPLTTVALTLIFSFVALTGLPLAKDFLDLAKLTLGAFIGSFVQRQVEQRRQEAGQSQAPPTRPALPT